MRLADALLREFGSFGATLAGSPRRWANIAGTDLEALAPLRTFRSWMMHALRPRPATRALCGGSAELIHYLHADMAWLTVERTRVLYLTREQVLLSDEILAEGTIDECQVHVREIIHRALDLGAAYLILAHNHPSGDGTPSNADKAITRLIEDAGAKLGVRVLDHIVVAACGSTSMRASGLL